MYKGAEIGVKNAGKAVELCPVHHGINHYLQGFLIFPQSKIIFEFCFIMNYTGYIISMLAIMAFSCKVKNQATEESATQEVPVQPKVPCPEIDPPCECGFFTLVNEEGQRLIGYEQPYNPDAFVLVNGGKKLKLYPAPDEFSSIEFNFRELTSGTPYYLDLGQGDTDTLSFELEYVEDPCLSTWELRGFQWNGKAITEENGVFQVVK